MNILHNEVILKRQSENYIKGEALAMRGFAYLQFAWCWGGVPLITTELSLNDTYKMPRSTQEETYAQSENDFKTAYRLLPEKWSSEDLGRVTKYAASGMLGRLYMYTHEYDSAKVYLEQVIAQENTLYKLETNYDDCFDDAKNNSPERVWEVQYMGGVQGQASDIEITAREIQKLKKELYTIIADHSHTPYEKVWADSDRDYWMTAQEAKEYGMVDEVLVKK